MPKKIWVLNYETEDLQSVDNISSGLVRLYSSLPKIEYDVSVIVLQDAERVSGKNWREWIEKFKKNAPEHIAVVHPSVNHHIFFQSLLSLACPFQIIVHVFGNFIRNGESWFSINHLLQNKNVQFATASTSYFNILENFAGADNLSLMPFPLQEIELPLARQKTGSEIRIIYAGRYHEQKNVSLLIEKLAELSSKIGRKIRLSLVVTFDDFNPTTLDEQKMLGMQFKKFLEVSKKNSDKIDLHLIHHTDFEALQKLYQTNDLFISLSTFLDEDYGCAVIESLCSGTPCIVSEWGGYKDFIKKFPHDCRGIKIELSEKGFTANFENMAEMILKLSEHSAKERVDLAIRAQSAYSLDKLGQQLKSIFLKESKFAGFSPNLKEFAELLRQHDHKSLELFKIYYKSFWEN